MKKGERTTEVSSLWALIPVCERPVYFDVAQCMRQDGTEDFTADDAARLEALGYSIVWPVAQEPSKA